MSYHLSDLDSTTASNYIDLTYPRLQSFLLQLDDEAGWMAIGAHHQGEPVGLALVHVVTSSTQVQTGFLHSLFVIPEQRQRGIGMALLQAVEARLTAQGCDRLSLEYLESATSPFLEKMLRQTGWAIPERVGLIVHGPDVRQLAPLFERVLKRPLPPDYKLFLWRDLTENERVNAHQTLSGEALRFNPSLEESYIEPLNSVGLRYQDRIIGWMITHRLSPDLIRYTTLYVRPEDQPLSRGLVLMMQAIKLQAQDGRVLQAIFNVNLQETPAMQKWAERRLAPYSDSMRYRFITTKSLQNSLALSA